MSVPRLCALFIPEITKSASKSENISFATLTQSAGVPEIEYASKFKNSHENYCSLWCVKEAVVKAFSNRKLCFQDIEVSSTPLGRPYIILNETIKKELEKAGAKEIKISLSHSKDYSTAICIIN
jgi:phosphopantetheine--protein transferase-like protein